MMTCSPETTIAEANAFMKRLIDEWLADGSPSPLLFAARYTSQAAAALRKAGQRDDWIRRELLAAFLDSDAARSSLGETFMETLNLRIDEALPPLDEDETPEQIASAEPAQVRFASWVEGGDSSDTAPLLLMTESLRSFALTLRELGRRDAIIRAEVLELVRANRGTMREGDLAFLERRVRLALDEILDSSIHPAN